MLARTLQLARPNTRIRIAEIHAIAPAMKPSPSLAAGFFDAAGNALHVSMVHLNSVIVLQSHPA